MASRRPRAKLASNVVHVDWRPKPPPLSPKAQAVAELTACVERMRVLNEGMELGFLLGKAPQSVRDFVRRVLSCPDVVEHIQERSDG